MSQEDLHTLIYAAIGLMGMQSFLTWGATYTIMSHANLYSSLSSIMIVAMRLAYLKPVTRFEIIGSIVALMGCVITTFDPDAVKTQTEDNKITFGNFLCFISSFFCTLYILKGQEISAKIPALKYLSFLTGIAVLLFYIIFPIAYWGQHFHFNFDLETGQFGWLAKENFWYNLIVISGINGVVTLYLQMLVFRYFTPVVAGTMMLLEPMFSQVYGIALGLDLYPGLITYIGGILILSGLYILLVYEDQPQKQSGQSIK